MDTAKLTGKSSILICNRRGRNRELVLVEPTCDEVLSALADRNNKQDLDGFSLARMNFPLEGGYSEISSLKIMSDGEYHLVMYSDNFDGNDFCHTPHNPDPSDTGIIEMGGNEWDKENLRMDFGFIREVFKAYIEKGRVPLDLFFTKSVIE